MSETISESVALQKLAAYCAYQERSEKEVRQKLRDLKTPDLIAEKIIEKLYAENFIQEERFARSFVRGKFNLKKWGKIKIRHRLQAHGISAQNIEKGLTEIDNDEYYDVIKELVEKKSVHEIDPKKMYQFLRQRGFESELIMEILQEMKI